MASSVSGARIDFLLQRMAARGVHLELSADDQIRVTGHLSSEDTEVLRLRRDEIVSFLSQPSDPDVDWESLRRLSLFLGRRVSYPSGSGILWSLSPRGAVVKEGGLLYTVEAGEVEVF